MSFNFLENNKLKPSIAESAQVKRVPQLDGVRGLAIALVVAYHGIRLPFGWAGVDLFFVLSGFLMTRILLRDRAKKVYWQPFYVRRSTRILPPFILCLIVGAMLFPLEWHHLKYYLLLFSANIGVAFYDSRAFGVLWSLSVEEHFYFCWPVIIRRWSDASIKKLLVGILCVEPILRGIATHFLTSYYPIYVLTPFRLDGLAAGSLLALVIGSRGRWTSRCGTVCMCTLALLAVLGLAHQLDHKSNSLFFNTLGYSLTSLAAASYVGYVLISETSVPARIMKNRWLGELGKVSYSVYLFHQYIMEGVNRLGDRLGVHHHLLLLPLSLVLVFCVGWISMKIFEGPILAWGQRMARRISSGAAHPATVSSI